MKIEAASVYITLNFVLLESDKTFGYDILYAPVAAERCALYYIFDYNKV